MVIGAAVIPMLNIQYQPTKRSQWLSISVYWPDASARVVEQEVTSVIEGALAPIEGVSNISSISYKEGGYVSLEFKNSDNLDAVRFEISSKIRQIFPQLPDGVSYPSLSTQTLGQQTEPMLVYTVNADLPTWQIGSYVQDNIARPLWRIKGVRQVDVNGATPFEWVVTFDSGKCEPLGITGEKITSAINDYLSSKELGIALWEQSQQINVVLKSTKETSRIEWGSIIVGNVDGRIVTLGELSTIDFKQALPTSYYRLNGLNNINLTVTPEKHVNNLALSDEVKSEIARLEASLPDGYSLSLVEDSSVYIRTELTKIYTRCTLSILILLLFVFIFSRSFRYLLMIVVTLAANVLVSFIFYNMLNIEIHLYSLAGITVSLGMIIDTSIIMIDHYGRYGNKKVFLAILAALLTTIGAITIVWFLPSDQRDNLVDFSIVMAVSLTVSMVISLIFIPALIDKFPLQLKRRRRSMRSLGRIARFTHGYKYWITWSRRHRWLYLVVLILAFGIPVQLLPNKIGVKPDSQYAELKDTLTSLEKLYNTTIGSQFYQKNLKSWIDPALGGSMRLFANSALGHYGGMREDNERTTLLINAALDDGCTVHQLNQTIKDMEYYLSDIDGIESFQTNVSSYRNASITVKFKEDAEKQGFAFTLKDLATSKAISLGGATWGVWGVGQGFSNRMGHSYKSNRIQLTGYNYDQLYRFAQELADTVALNPRASDVEISGEVSWDGSGNATEYYLNFDSEKFAVYGLNAAQYFTALQGSLYQSDLHSVYENGVQQRVVLRSSEQSDFDVWRLNNDAIMFGDRAVKLSDIGSIEKRQSGNNIYKENQEYKLTVAFDFKGSSELASRFIKRTTDWIESRLPVGYKVKDSQWDWWGENQGTQYSLLLLVIAIIYVICAVLFESLRQPLVIIALIPVSFIGVFLTFWMFDLQFDQGGFAAFVLLCGLVVNAGIYIVNEYNGFRGGGLDNYLRAFNRKIMPIMLTVISTVLGLVPFVLISREPFWFSFAVAAMGGMLFSILAIIGVLPVFIPLRARGF